MSAALPAAGAAGRGARDGIADVRAILDGWVADGRMPGVQYVHVAPDGLRFAHCAGLARPLDAIAVSDLTTFNAYSITKTFTAAAVLQLVSQGRIALDAPLAAYLEEFPRSASPTVRETLSHTAGLPNPNPLSWCHLDSEHAAFDPAPFVARILAESLRHRGRPGRAYRYSNVGYLWLGLLLERISGRAYVDQVRESLIAPLQLGAHERLGFAIDDPGHHACGCVPRWSLLNPLLGLFIDRRRYIEGRSGRWLQLRHLHVDGAAYGGLIGNALGLGRYLRALLGDSGYLPAGACESLFPRAAGRCGSRPQRSLGWFTGELRGEHYFAHAGGAAGYYCEIRVYPRIGRGSVVMTNRTGVRDQRLLDRIDRSLVAAA